MHSTEENSNWPAEVVHARSFKPDPSQVPTVRRHVGLLEDGKRGRADLEVAEPLPSVTCRNAVRQTGRLEA